MVKGALFTFGILTTLGGAGLGILSFMGAAMSDNTQDTTFQTVTVPCGIAALVGVGMIVGACLL